MSEQEQGQEQTVPQPPPLPNKPQIEEEETVPKVEESKSLTKKKKTFTKESRVPFVHVKIQFPDILPDYEPFCFKFGLALTGQAEERRREYLSLSAFEMASTSDIQTLDEVCDLLLEIPEGFGDIEENPSLSPGDSFRHYVESSGPEQKPILDKIIEGAYNKYYNMITPRIFRS